MNKGLIAPPLPPPSPNHFPTLPEPNLTKMQSTYNLFIILTAIICTELTQALNDAEPEGLGTIDDTSKCNEIDNGPKLTPIRVGVDVVILKDMNFQSSSDHPVCAVGVGGDQGNFKGHGGKNPSVGIPFSWMNQNPDETASSYTTEMQVEIFYPNFNVVDRNAQKFTNDWGGKCTCPDGTDIFVAAKLSTDCEELSCYGGVKSTCEKKDDPSWSSKVGYCSTKSATKTVETTHLFAALDNVVPTFTAEGGRIEITKTMLNGNTIDKWIKIDGSAMEHYTLLQKLPMTTSEEECQSKCTASLGCLGYQRESTECGACCMFAGTVLIQPKTDTNTFVMLKEKKYHQSIQPSQCLALAIQMHGSKVVAKEDYLKIGTWNHLPEGCSVFTENWQAHYNLKKNPSSVNEVNFPRVTLPPKEELIHNSNFCWENGKLDCDCCAAPGQGTCQEGSSIEMLKTACWVQGSGTGNFPLPNSGTYRQRYKCNVRKDYLYDLYDPSYASGQLSSNAVFSNEDIGEYHGR